MTWIRPMSAAQTSWNILRQSGSEDNKLQIICFTPVPFGHWGWTLSACFGLVGPFFKRCWLSALRTLGLVQRMVLSSVKVAASQVSRLTSKGRSSFPPNLLWLLNQAKRKLLKWPRSSVFCESGIMCTSHQRQSTLCMWLQWNDFYCRPFENIPSWRVFLHLASLTMSVLKSGTLSIGGLEVEVEPYGIWLGDTYRSHIKFCMILSFQAAYGTPLHIFLSICPSTHG